MRRRRGAALALALLAGALFPLDGRADGACDRAARDVDRACRKRADAALWLTRGHCRNQASGPARSLCLDGADGDRRRELARCGERLEARRMACGLLREDSYDPRIVPAEFVARIDHAFFPLQPGTSKMYSAQIPEGALQMEVHVTPVVRDVLGVPCRVVRESVLSGGQVLEERWKCFAQDVRGNVWKFGEVRYSIRNGEVAGIGKAWEAGIDGAKPGIFMPATPPRVGDAYRLELLPGQAETIGVILDDEARALVPYGAFEGCLIIGAITPLAPGTSEHQTYAPGLGLIRVERGERSLELVAAADAGPGSAGGGVPLAGAGAASGAAGLPESVLVEVLPAEGARGPELGVVIGPGLDFEAVRIWDQMRGFEVRLDLPLLSAGSDGDD